VSVATVRRDQGTLKPSPLYELRRWWNKAGAPERDEFLKWIGE
jgi:hypothetical protein